MTTRSSSSGKIFSAAILAPRGTNGSGAATAPVELPLSVGMAIQARYLATKLGPFGTKWYDGVVKDLHSDGTVAIQYADNDFEDHVARRYIRLPRAKAPTKGLAAADLPHAATHSQQAPASAKRKRDPPVGRELSDRLGPTPATRFKATARVKPLPPIISMMSISPL